MARNGELDVQNRLALLHRSVGNFERYEEHRERTEALLKMPMKPRGRSGWQNCTSI